MSRMLMSSAARGAVGVLTAVSLLVAGLVAASVGAGAGDAAPCGTKRPERARDLLVRAETPGGALTASLHLPAGAVGSRVPLVLAFHGSGGSGPFMRRYSGLARIADRQGFAVAFPTARAPERVWELKPEENPALDDVAAVRALLDRLSMVACVDPGRISAVGISNGGGFTARLACSQIGLRGS